LLDGEWRKIMKAKRIQLVWGFLFGIIFGFLLQKGGVTKYDVIIGQLLLTDFTVLKIMLSAVIAGMIGIYFMQSRKWIDLHVKSGSLGKNIIGGLIFGLGFALLGYCPGTIAGAIGNGYLDATVTGLAGIILGSGIYAAVYPRLKSNVLEWGNYGDLTLPRLLRVNNWVVIVPLAAILIIFMFFLEQAGL
jgi:uncharacterized membrane protein YedE/YeeE